MIWQSRLHADVLNFRFFSWEENAAVVTSLRRRAPDVGRWIKSEACLSAIALSVGTLI